MHLLKMAKLFMETEGWLPAPESAYSVCSAIEEAIKCRESGEPKVIAFNVSGHGFLDIYWYRTVLGLE
jgi:tryptophan synthase beta chain